jgi:molybdopterin synthase sulfur carrier subunit
MSGAGGRPGRITVLYFARLREALGRTSDEFDLPAGVDTVGALRHWLIARGEPWAGAFAQVRRVRAAVGQDMATDDTSIVAGAEVAFFPPVTGG